MKPSTESIVADLRDLAMFVGLNDKRGASLIRTAADRLEELEAAVEKLPKTADGVPVVPGMAIWHCCGNSIGSADVHRPACYQGKTDKCHHPPRINGTPRKIIEWCDCYSTREAALAAQEANHDQ